MSDKFLENMHERVSERLSFFKSPDFKKIMEKASEASEVIRPAIKKIQEVTEHEQERDELWDITFAPRMDAPIPKRKDLSLGEVLLTKNKELVRKFANRELIYSFDNSRRLSTVESLIELGQDGATMELMLKITGCPSPEAVRKFIGDINSSIESKLKIKSKFGNLVVARGRHIGGYQINPKLSIETE
jgi:hypothetical protein